MIPHIVAQKFLQKKKRARSLHSTDPQGHHGPDLHALLRAHSPRASPRAPLAGPRAPRTHGPAVGCEATGIKWSHRLALIISVSLYVWCIALFISTMHTYIQTYIHTHRHKSGSCAIVYTAAKLPCQHHFPIHLVLTSLHPSHRPRARFLLSTTTFMKKTRTTLPIDRSAPLCRPRI